MSPITFPMEGMDAYKRAAAALDAGKGPLVISGCADTQRVQLACQLSKGHPALFVTYSAQRAREAADDAACFTDSVLLYPAKDLLFFQADAGGNVLARQRMEVWQHIATGGSGLVIATIDGCMDKIPPMESVIKSVIRLGTGRELDLPLFCDTLVRMGYSREEMVEGPGQFAVRGGIADIFPLTFEQPCRVELWGDEIDSIRVFDVRTQRSLEAVDDITIYPASEEAVSGYAGTDAGKVLFPQYFDDGAYIFLDEPARLQDAAKAIADEVSECIRHRGFCKDSGEAARAIPDVAPAREAFSALTGKRTAALCALETSAIIKGVGERFHIEAQPASNYHEGFRLLIDDLLKWKRDGGRTLLLIGSKTRAGRLALDLEEYGVAAFYAEDGAHEVRPGQTMVTCGSLHRGFYYPLLNFRCLTEGDLFAKRRRVRGNRKKSPGGIRSLSDISAGDYVVHEGYGLGIYNGMEHMNVRGVEKDYIKITYGDGGILYMPVTQMDLLQKYADADASPKPRLNRLGSPEWKKTKAKVRTAVGQIARELVELYAVRSQKQGHAFSKDTVWQREFEEQFPYDETQDQLAATDAVKKDMESPRIMDRLICGDVGYGKTEVALRAAFKAVCEGMQAAFLVPTTILAQQHFNTIRERLKNFPVTVGLLSRFRTPAQQKETIRKLAEGGIDIIVGTHRLLSQDVKFADLGLLVIDEEQRFGVSDKEKIKRLKSDVDVLSLSATPIPRTLHMSLIGIRDMSILEEAPDDRSPIQTYVMEYTPELVREAISRELSRGGQVFVVSNRIRGINEVAAGVQALAPDARVATAHGRMAETVLERRMLDFINGETDILVSTAIIENGIDIPNANTIIILDADKLGLSQLHQLRGRVGRSGRTAYAFLMYRRDRQLTEVAEKRLVAISRYTQLGSGTHIAMRDLEIRGTGNLLGEQQHGHMEAVGYEYYCKLMSQAIDGLKGKKRQDMEFETSVDLPVDAFIPDGYMEGERQKLEAYRRIACIGGQEDMEDVMDEFIDRYGTPPKPAQNLIQIAALRKKAHEAYISEICSKKDGLHFTILPSAPVDTLRIQPWLEGYRGFMRVIAGNSPEFVLKAATLSDDVLKQAGDVVDGIKSLICDRP